MAHYRERKLFYSENHPCNEVLKELAERILRHIGISDLHIEMKPESLDFTLRGQDVPIYPAVKKAIGKGMQSVGDSYFANRYLWDFQGEFSEFIKKYVDVCFYEKE